MASKDFKKNNETISPQQVAPSVIGNCPTLKAFLEQNVFRGGLIQNLNKAGYTSFEDLQAKNSKIGNVVERADLINTGLPHKIQVEFVTCPKTAKKYLVDVIEKPNEAGGKADKGEKPKIKKVPKIIKKSNGVGNDVEEKYDETYGGKKKPSSK